MRLSFSLVMLFGLLSQMSCDSEHKKKENEEVLVTNPVKRDIVTIQDYVCQIRAIQHIELRALEKGYLEKIYVDEGQYVKKGQLMFKILPPLYKAELHKAKAEADFAKIEYLNAKSLADSNVVSPNQLALEKAKYEKAKAELELAEVQMGFTEIRAPFDGLMDRFKVRLGSLLDEGELLTTLSDIGNLWVYFNVPEAEYLDYKTQMKKDKELIVELKLANGKMFDHKGVVKTIEADFNNETGNIAFRATFPNPDGLLRHGETGSIIISKHLNDVLLIPQKSTFEILDKKYVYIMDKNKVIHSHQIEIEAEIPDLYAVSKGLKKSDKILVEGLRKIRDKDTVKYEFQSPDKILSRLKLHAE